MYPQSRTHVDREPAASLAAGRDLPLSNVFYLVSNTGLELSRCRVCESTDLDNAVSSGPRTAKRMMCV